MKQQPLEPRIAFDSLKGDESFVYLKQQAFAESDMRSKAILAVSIILAFSWLGRIVISVAVTGLYDKQKIDFFIFAFLFFIALGYSAYEFIRVRQRNSALGITDEYVYYRHGLLNTREARLGFFEIRQVNLKWQDFHARKHNYGKVHIILTNGRAVPLVAVDDPEKFKRLIESHLPTQLMPT